MHPGTKNLIPVKKGEVRNPKGRPKGAKSRSTLWAEFLAMPASDGKGGSNHDMLIRLAVRAAETGAERGNVAAITMFMDNAFGKIAEKSEVQHTVTQMPNVYIEVPDGMNDVLSFECGDVIEGDVIDDTAQPLETTE